MDFNSRQSEILQIIRNERFASVESLASRYTVSPQTIRRDVNQLCDLGLLRRQHGGVGLPASYENIAYETRSHLQAEEKIRIARAVAGLIPDNTSLFIGIGTTTVAVARALMQHRGLRVVTNNLEVADLFCRNPSFEVILAGGRARNLQRDFIGEAALAVFRDIRVDFGILSVGGLDCDGSLRDFDFDEVRLSRLILDNAEHPIVVADHTKFRCAAAVRFGRLSEARTLVTDAPISAALGETVAACGVALLVAEAEQ